MKCLILAAGYATRLYPLTENFPKPLLKVGEKTILDWLVDDIAATGKVDEFIIVTNDRFTKAFSDWAFMRGLRFENDYNDNLDETKLDTAYTESSHPITIRVINDLTTTNETRLGAVKDMQIAMRSIGYGDDMLVIAGDNVLDFSFAHFLDFAETKNTSCVMCHEENDLAKQQRTAIITFDENNLITSYEEKPQEPKGHYAVPPFYFYKREDTARIGEALRDGCHADAPGSFAAWLSHQTAVHAFPMPGHRYDIGNLESYQHVQEVYKGIKKIRGQKGSKEKD